MSAAAQPRSASPKKCAVAPEPLPWSNRNAAPDRGDWEYLRRAVGVVRVRPTPAPIVEKPASA